MKTSRKHPRRRPLAVVQSPGAVSPPSTRSRVTNGALHLTPVNGNTAAARRFRDLVSAFLAEAGLTTPTEGEIGLCRRAAGATVQLEDMEAAMARGEPIDCPTYRGMASVLRASRHDLGLGPVAPGTTGDDLDNLLEKEGFGGVS